MERKFKHKITNKVIKIGGKTGLSCQTLIGNSDLILGDIIKGEDWEEVIEKDYEILSLHDKRNQFPILNLIDGCCPVTGIKYPELGSEDWNIHSIKRKSDGEVFTIGDKVNNSTFGGNGTIENIKLSGNYIYFRLNWQIEWKDSDDSECFLKNLSKIKQPLFTTEDGVDIFEGDIYWLVTEHYNYGINYTKVNSDYTETIKNNNKRFSTKEKAEEYILMNKPCLSLQEVLNVLQLPLYKNHTNKKYIEELKQITNTKING